MSSLGTGAITITDLNDGLNYSIELSAPVFYKDAVDAGTTGAYTSIVATGKKTLGSFKETFGFITIQLNSGSESAPVADTVTIAPASNSGANSYTIRLYQDSNKTGGALATITVPVVFKGQVGSPGTPAKLITLAPSAQVFKVDVAGAISPATITVTGTTQSTSISSWSYSVNGGAYSATVPTGVSRSGNVVTLTGSTITANQISIKASDGTVEDIVTIAKVVDGAPAKVLTLTTTMEAFSFNADGTPTSSQSATLTASPENLTGTATFSAIPYTSAGAALTAITLGGTGNSRTLTTAQWPSTAVRVVITATLGGYSDTVTILQLKDGEKGADPITGYLTNESITLPADAAGTVSSFATATGTFEMYEGLLRKTGTGVTYARGTQTNCTASINATTGVYSVTAMTADTASVIFTATLSGVTITKTLSLAKSKQGTQGLPGVDGLQGPKGDQGIPGPSGTSSYTHIAYSTSATGSTGFSVSHFPTATYIGIYVDNSPTDSTNPASYKWNLIKGADGAQGIPGQPGADGQTPYFHTAWADSADGTVGFSTTVSTNKKYIGVYTDYTAADSNSPSMYDWSLIKGEDALVSTILNENQSIAATSGRLVTAATTINIPFNAYLGTTRVAATAALGTLPSGVTVTSNTAATTSADGLIVLAVAANANLGGTTTAFDSGSFTVTITANGVASVKTFNWTKTVAGAAGANATLYLIDSSVQSILRKADNSLTVSSIVFQSRSRTGTSTTKSNRTAYWKIESFNGTTWSQIASHTAGLIADYTLSTSAIPSDSILIRATATSDTGLVTAYSYTEVPVVKEGSYTWIMYADTATGSGISASSEGKRFIGVAMNKTTSTPSTTPGDYTWSPLYDNVVVGGRNYILDSANKVVDRLGWTGASGEYFSLNVGDSYKQLAHGTEVTISFDLEILVNTANPSLLVYNTNSKGPKTFDGRTLSFVAAVGTTIKERVSVTTSIRDLANPTLSYNSIEFYSTYGTSNFFKITNIKLEKGNIATDWTPAPEDIEAALISLGQDIDEVSQAVNDLDTYIDGSFADGIIEEAEAKAIEKYLNSLNTEKNDIDSRYNTLYADANLFGSPKTNLLNAKTAYNTAHANLISSINTAISGGSVTPAQKTDVDNKFTAYRTALSTLSTRFEEAVGQITKKISDANKVDNPAANGGEIGNWSASGLTVVNQDFQGMTSAVLQSSVSSDTQNYSGYFNADPSKAYMVSAWFKKSAMTGMIYFGLNAINSAGSTVGVQRVGNTTGTVGLASDTNPYFWSVSGNGLPIVDWVKITAYIMPAGTTPSRMKNIGENTQQNFIMTNQVDRIRLRFLNWSNAGTTRQVWVANPTVVEVDPEAVLKASEAYDGNVQTRTDLRLTAPLPTSISLDSNGITATTASSTKFARLDYRGLYIQDGAIDIRTNGALSNRGVLFDGNGIRGYNSSGTKTFEIDSNGNAFFGGTLSGATGTFSGTITGGSITSNSTINVTTDLYVGNNIYVGNINAPLGTIKTIFFNDLARIKGGTGYVGAGIDISCNELAFASVGQFIFDTQTKVIGVGGGKLIMDDAFVASSTSETSYCAFQAAKGNVATIGAVGVSFRYKKTYTPSSVTLNKTAGTSTSSAAINDLTTNGFLLIVTDSSASSGSSVGWRGTYTA